MPRVQRSEPAQRRSIAGARGIQQRTCLLALVLEIEAQRLLRFLQSGWHGHGNLLSSCLPSARQAEKRWAHWS
jgi:hypothetical protein